MKATIHLLLLILITAGVVSGQNDSLISIDEVVITAQFQPTETSETVNRVRVLSKTTIEQRAAVNLQELLQTEARIRLANDPVLGSGIAINGLRGENVRILVDGVPVVGRLDGSVDAGQLPLAAVQQVEIIEGAQSLMYGSEASAGVVNLITRRNTTYRAEGEVSSQWEHRGFSSLNARAAVTNKPLSLQLSGSVLKFSPATDGSGSRDQLWNPKQQISGKAMVRFQPSDRWEMRLSAGAFRETVDNLGEIRRPQFKPYAFDDFYHNSRADITLHSEGRTRANLFWQGTAGWNRFYRIKNSYRFDVQEATNTLIDGQQDTSSAEGWLGRFSIATDRRDRWWNLLAGGEHFTEIATGARIVDTTREQAGRASNTDLAVFSALQARFGTWLKAQAGARWTYNLLYGSVVTPSVWVKWQPSTNCQVRVSFAQGFRSPGLKELYFNFVDINHDITGNTALGPERSNNLRGEVVLEALTFRSSTIQLTATSFYNHIRNRIVLVQRGPVAYTYGNVERWETAGGSIGVMVRAGTWLHVSSEVVHTGIGNDMTGENNYLWSTDWVNEVRFSFYQQRVFVLFWHKTNGRTPFFFEGENGEITTAAVPSWNLVNFSSGIRLFNNRVNIQAGVKNLLNVKQINAAIASGVHGGQSQQLIHWGRTPFVSASVALHSRR